MTANRNANARRLQERVSFEPDAAAALLSLVADYIEDGERLPAETCAWFVKAVRVMASVEPGENGEPVEHARAAALATELGIVKRPGPPSKFVSRRDVRRLVVAYGDEVSETKLADGVAEAYGVGLSTARKHVKAAKRGIAEGNDWFAAIMAENDLEGLIEPRGGDGVRRSSESSL